MSTKVIVLLALVAAAAAYSGDCKCKSCMDCLKPAVFCGAIGGTLACDDSLAPGQMDATCTFPTCGDTNKQTCEDWCEEADCSSRFELSCDATSCFPASATVTLEDGSTKTMAQLTVGDRVLVAPNTFSPVYMFSHQLEATKTAFVAVEAGAASLLLTPDHYLYVNGQLAVARTVRVGDRVTLADGTQAAVTKVHTEWASGLYNPHTLHGDIVVNGVQTSTYTQGIAPSVAHAALWPVRALFQAGVAVADSTFAAGSDLLTHALPNGAAVYAP